MRVNVLVFKYLASILLSSLVWVGFNICVQSDTAKLAVVQNLQSASNSWKGREKPKVLI